MSPETLRKELSLLIQSLLEKASLQKGFEVLGAHTTPPAQRLLGLEAKEYGYLAYIASDDLTLEQKTELEKYLVQSFSSKELSLRIYFKRLQALSGRLGSVATAASASKGPQLGPFGTKLRRKPISGVKKIIAVSSGKGGVGKSTVSVNLAVGLALQGLSVGLLDADLYGPSAPLLMGLEGLMPVSADQKMIPLERHGVKVVSFGFMSDPYHPVIWRGPMVAKALEQLFYQSAWGDLDYLIIDLPPGTGDVQLTMIESLPLYAGIVVSTPQAVALLDAHKGLTMFEKLKVPILGLVENMSHFQCGSCGHYEDIFGQAQIEAFARERKTEILTRIPLSRRIREASDAGVPVIIQDPAYAQYYLELVEKVIEFGASSNQTPDQAIPSLDPII